MVFLSLKIQILIVSVVYFYPQELRNCASEWGHKETCSVDVSLLKELSLEAEKA
jgi:hypothetical protein